MATSFPRRHARTRGFTLGRPRGFQVGADGARVAFLRSAAGDDPVNRLWVLDLASGTERLVADPAALLGDAAEDLPPEERARRERARERAGGIVVFAADPDLTVASFALAGRLFVAALDDPDGQVRELPVGDGVLDPRVDPTGRRVAWAAATRRPPNGSPSSKVPIKAPNSTEVSRKAATCAIGPSTSA